MGKYLNVNCDRCGKTEEIFTVNGHQPAFYICHECKIELERKPKELFRTIGLGAEADHRRESEAASVSYPSADKEDFEKEKRSIKK